MNAVKCGYISLSSDYLDKVNAIRERNNSNKTLINQHINHKNKFGVTVMHLLVKRMSLQDTSDRVALNLAAKILALGYNLHLQGMLILDFYGGGGTITKTKKNKSRGDLAFSFYFSI